jgi:hypothetical protein
LLEKQVGSYHGFEGARQLTALCSAHHMLDLAEEGNPSDANHALGIPGIARSSFCFLCSSVSDLPVMKPG